MEPIANPNKYRALANWKSGGVRKWSMSTKNQEILIYVFTVLSLGKPFIFIKDSVLKRREGKQQN
jgi:hypothetical protein